MTADYFLDESGNTGDLARPGERFDFGRQEVFTLACLGVQDAPALDAELIKLKQKHRVQAAELKSSSVRDKPALVTDLAAHIALHDLPVMIEVVDKRFMIAANIVNTLVVPPVGPPDLTPEAQWLSNAMAEFIHAHAPSSAFEAFVAACDTPSDQMVSAAFTAMIEWLQSMPPSDVSYGILRFVQASFKDFQDGDPADSSSQQRHLPLPDTGKRGQSIWMLPNLTSLTNIYARLNLLHRRRLSGITLFHDEQTHFDDILRQAMRSAEGLAEAGAAPPMRFADYHFEERAQLVFLNSHASPGIQAADVLAGFVMRYTKDVLFGGEAPSSDARAAFRQVLALGDPARGLGINFVLPTRDLLRLGVRPS
jgi:hypothetical protein